jgi:hypothetical protein
MLGIDWMGWSVMAAKGPVLPPTSTDGVPAAAPEEIAFVRHGLDDCGFVQPSPFASVLMELFSPSAIRRGVTGIFATIVSMFR